MKHNIPVSTGDNPPTPLLQGGIFRTSINGRDQLPPRLWSGTWFAPLKRNLISVLIRMNSTVWKKLDKIAEVTSAAVLGYPLVSIEIPGIELFCEVSVFFIRNAIGPVTLHTNPFGIPIASHNFFIINTGRHGIQTKMNKHAKTCLVPPFILFGLLLSVGRKSSCKQETGGNNYDIFFIIIIVLDFPKFLI